MVRSKLLPNCPITTHDITNTNSMFLPDLAGVRGNILRKKPIRVDKEEYVNIPEDFYRLHNFVMLAVNVMFVIGN